MLLRKYKERKTLKSIQNINAGIQREKIKSILMYYDMNIFFIGDTLKDISKTLLVKRFYPNAKIDFVTSNSKVLELLQNSPYVSSMTKQHYKDLSFENYDLIYIISDNELEIMKSIVKNHWNWFKQRPIPYFLFSLTSAVFNDEKPVKFPTHYEIIEYEYNEEDMRKVANTEVFLSNEELNWANEYLKEQGLKKDEDLAILLDSTSNKGKLIDEEQFFETVRLILKKEKAKILVYDIEEEGEKKKRYEKKLTEEELARIIFSRTKSLRKDICILGNKQVKTIIGPCTGIMHCASGVYTVLGKDIPSILVYKGFFDQMDATDDVYWWWGGNSMVNCLLLLKNEEEPLPILLSKLEKEVTYHDLDYTSKIKAKQLLEVIEY